MTSMGGMFYLLAMLLYVKGRLSIGTPRLLYWVGMVLSYLFGLFTKENVAIFPLFVALYEFYFFQSLDLSPKRKKILFYLAGAVILTGVLMSIFWGKRYFDVIIEGYKTRDFTLTERVLTQFRVVLYYVTLLLYPHPSRLNLDYDFPISRGILDPPTTLISILMVAGLIGYSIWKARKRPLLSFFVLWYFGNLVIESSVFPLELVFEHRLYLPAVGPFVLFAILVVRGWEKIKGIEHRRQKAVGSRQKAEGKIQEAETRRQEAESGWHRYFLLQFTFSFVIVLLSIGTYQRNNVWKDAVTLWEDCVKKSPNKPRAHNNLGASLVKDKKFERGIEELNTALRLNPKHVNARFNLGLAYGEMKLFDKATFHLGEYLRLAPEDPEGYNEIGLISLEQKKAEEAILFFKKGLEFKPDMAKLHANLGDAYLQQKGMADEAISEYKKAMSLDLNLTSLHIKLAEVYQKKGLPDLAMEELQKSLQTEPTSYETYVILGASYLQKGKMNEAIAALTQGLKYNSNDPEVFNNLGVAYRRKNLLNEAITNYRKALSIDPSFSDARINLGEIYFEKGMVNEAISEFRHVIETDPRRAEAYNNLGVIFLRTKRLEEAISSFKKALTINPKYGDAYFNLAVAYYYRKDIPSASLNAKKALGLGYEVDPKLLKALRIRQ
jgi:tetratricopeptide (TPR) repeat protein